MQITNYHTHTLFCDGHASPEEYIEFALNSKLHSLGFSAHYPLPFENAWSLKSSRVDEYIRTISELKKKYAENIIIYKAFEIDYIPGITDNFTEVINKYNLDYLIGSIHLVKSKDTEELWFIDGVDNFFVDGLKNIFQNNIKEGVEAFYHQSNEMIIKEKPTIIGHLDKIKMNNKNRFFDTEEQWYKNLCYETVDVIAESNCIVEVNTRGIYKKRTMSLFPGIDILKQCHLKKIPITINSDAHSPKELLLYFTEAIDILKVTGFKGHYILDDKEWKFESFE